MEIRELSATKLDRQQQMRTQGAQRTQNFNSMGGSRMAAQEWAAAAGDGIRL